MIENRRQVLTRLGSAALTAAGVGALAQADAPAAADDPPLPIVDTHQHLWNLDKFRLPWLDKSPKLNRSFVTRDYLAATQGLNVVKAIYMEVAVDTPQLAAEAKHVIELCRRDDNPTAAAVIGGRPEDEGFAKYIRQFKDEPCIKGVRRILFDPAPCEKKTFVEGVRLLGRLGMRFDLCMKAADLPLGVKLVDRCPDTRFILDHCGNADPKAFRPNGNKENTDRFAHDPDAWRRDVAALARRSNVVCKISGVIARAPDDWTPADLAPIVNHCLDTFGPDRVMFGSDWPVCRRAATLREWVGALKEIIRDRSEEERRKLLTENAVAFYGLESLEAPKDG